MTPCTYHAALLMLGVCMLSPPATFAFGLTSGNTTPGTLSQRWSFPTGDQVWSSPAVSGDGATVYVGSDDNNVYAINA